MRFTISSEVVATPEQFGERLRSENYDVVVAQHPIAAWKSTEALELLRKARRIIPLIFVTDGMRRETAAELMMKGAFDCVEMDGIGHLPIAILRALDEETLRGERDRAQRQLRRSEARYRALAGNLSYGIFRCNLDGKFLDVNQALTVMLAYESKDELLAINFVGNILQDPGKKEQLLGQADGIDPLEVEWKRKDGKILRVRLSGQRVAGETDTYEVIVEDITKQRALEDHLRRLAASDPLTGLANYRRLTEVLDTEIRRSNRTGREFALLMLDVDGLKHINDQFGHVIGSQVLCRVADVLGLCCRDIDTAARFGGDEFAVVLPEIGKEAAESVARRICATVSSDSNGPAISVSAGIAVYPEDGDRIDALLGAADSAMYWMKRKKFLE